MATFNNGESGSSVRTKINAVLQHTDGTAGELVINEAGADVDFRVESDTNANALFVDGATGNVGIGATPFYRLHVADATLTSTTAGSNVAARLQSNGAGADVNLQFSDGVSNASQIGMVGGSVYVRTAGSESMRVDSSGNLLVGTSSSTEKLTVSHGNGYFLRTGGAKLRLADQNNEVSVESLPSGVVSDMVFKTSALERMRIDASGNLLIGTATSGASKLRISGLPTSSAGLSAGDVWNDGGTLKIA